jgi:UPF0755 protein
VSITGRHARVDAASMASSANAATARSSKAAPARRQAPPPKKKGSKLPLIILVLLLVLGGAGAAWYFTSNQEGDNPNLLEADQTVQLTFPEGSLASDFTSELYDAGVINHKSDFTKRMTETGADSQLKPGVYTFSGGMTDDEIIEVLKAGPGMSLTVAEGQTMKTIAQNVETVYEGEVTAKQFLKACTNPKRFVDDYPFLDGVKNLEGFLCPKSYERLILSDDGNKADQVVRQMLDQYVQETSDLDYSYPRKQGLDDYETLILASIVEKEGTSDTYAKVAAVFYNRLTTDGDPTYGFLGSDATTAYELDGTQELDSYDWSTQSPYNTRTTKGLPPTPICSPGHEVLEAVCHPAEDMEDYYFFSFWPNDEGGVDYFFDKTYEDHLKTVAEHS